MNYMKDSEYTHVSVCKEAIVNENIFNNFKNIREYTNILEHANYEQGIGYLLNIFNNEEYKKFNWNLLLENDLIGNPKTFNYKDIFDKYDIKLNNYNISPTTLRYISFGINMIKYILNYKKDIDIVEVGGGYGGQCKILFDLSIIYDINIKSYTIIDLSDVSDLQKKYLDKLGYVDKIHYQKSNNITIKNYDFFISNFALSEFVDEVRDFYIENVLKYSKYYYMVWNTEKIQDYLINSDVLEEIPKTGIYNKILIYKDKN